MLVVSYIFIPQEMVTYKFIPHSFGEGYENVRWGMNL